MPIPTATEPASGEETINSLLGGDLATEAAEPSDAGAPVDGAEPAVEEGTEPQGDAVVEEGEESPEDGGEPQLDEGAEGESGEEDFDEQSLETDFADSAYERAAKHWAARGVTLDQKDAGQRALLKDWMERGRKLSDLETKARESEQEPEETAEEQQDKPQPAQALTPEQVEAQSMEHLRMSREFAKSRIQPKVAMEFSKDFVNALWPGKKAGEALTQEQANALTMAFTTFGTMLIGELSPAINRGAPDVVAERFPNLERVDSMAAREAAVEEVLSVQADGKPSYPRMEEFLDNGTIKRVMNAELKDAVFSKDPQKNLVAKMKTAYRMAAGQGVDPKLITQAVTKGKEIQAQRQRAVGAGRNPSGHSRRGFTDGKATFKETLLGGGGSKFGRLLADAKR